MEFRKNTKQTFAVKYNITVNFPTIDIPNPIGGNFKLNFPVPSIPYPVLFSKLSQLFLNCTFFGQILALFP